MVALANKSATFPQRPLRGRAQNHRYRSGAERCSKSNTQTTLRRSTYDECFRLGSCSKGAVGIRGGASLYIYVGNNLTKFVDPSGLAKIIPDPNNKNKTKVHPCGGWHSFFGFRGSAKGAAIGQPFIVIQKICIFASGSVTDCETDGCVCKKKEEKKCNECCYLEVIGGGEKTAVDGSMDAFDENFMNPYSGSCCKSTGSWSITAEVRWYTIDAVLAKLIDALKEKTPKECDPGCVKALTPDMTTTLNYEQGIKQLWDSKTISPIDKGTVTSSATWDCCGGKEFQDTIVVGQKLPSWKGECEWPKE